MRILLLFAITLMFSLSWAADGEVRLLYAGNLAGGDEAQRAEVAAQLAALTEEAHTGGMPALLLLPGNLCSPEPIAAVRDAAALAAAAGLAPAAVAIGPREWRWGSDYLRRRLPEAPLPWVSLNAAPRGQPPAPFRVLTAGRLRVGVIGLTLPPGAMPDVALHEQVRRTAATLRRRCDLVVLLGAFDARQAPVLTALLSEVDVVLGEIGGAAPEAYGASVLASLDAEAPYVGVLDCAVRDGRLAAWRGWHAPCLAPEEIPTGE